jgi:hypothetical protein
MKRIIESLIAGCISGILLKAVDGDEGILQMKDLYNTFVIELWYIWAGVIIAILYWFVRYQLDIHKSNKTIAEEIIRIKKSLKNNHDELYDSWNRTVGNYNNVLRELSALRQTLEREKDLTETKG